MNEEECSQSSEHSLVFNHIRPSNYFKTTYVSELGEFVGYEKTTNPQLFVCSTHIGNKKVPEGKVVVLSFRFIDLESDNLCRYDFVDVYSGHDNGQRLGRFCGTSRPGSLVANNNKMLVQMISDANTAGNGFVAKFSAAEPHERGDQYCGGRLDKPSGSFKTPNWPDRDYPAGVTCSWHIVAPKNQLIELKFEKFDVERDNYCRYDYVAVFNGGEINDAKRIGKYCGDSPPA
ncbi:UNVERIFIED_CONTAM: Procollagen C-endopeptidase enhancer 2 [Gekko kuhli]